MPLPKVERLFPSSLFDRKPEALEIDPVQDGFDDSKSVTRIYREPGGRLFVAYDKVIGPDISTEEAYELAGGDPQP